jgi:hypothetical protein
MFQLVKCLGLYQAQSAFFRWIRNNEMTVKWFCIVLLVPTLLAAEDVPPLVPVETDKSTGSNLTIDSWTPKETPHPVVDNASFCADSYHSQTRDGSAAPRDGSG